MDNNNNQNNKNGKPPRGNQSYLVLFITMLFTLLCVGGMHSLWQQSRTEQVPYSEFIEMLKDGEVESVVVNGNKLQITPKKDSKRYTGSQSRYGGLIGIEYYTVPMNDPDLLKKLEEAGVARYEQAQANASDLLIVFLVQWVLPIGLMVLFLNFMMKRMGGGGGIMGGRGKGIADRDRGFSAQSGKIYHDRREAPQGRAARGPSRNGKDAFSQGGGRGGEGSLLFPVRLGLCGDVCRCRRFACPRLV